MPRPRRKRAPDPPVRANLTPLIDVTFLILVFFLFTIRFRALEGLLESSLPREAGPGSQSEAPRERERIVLRVVAPGTRLEVGSDAPWRGGGSWRYGPDRALEYGIGPHRTSDLAVVRERLRALLREDPELEVLIDPREGCIHADVVGLLDLARAVGVRRLGLTAARGARPATD